MKSLGPETITLKNLKTVLLRQAEPGDAERLLQCIRTYVPQSQYIPKLKQEITMTPAQAAEWIGFLLVNHNSLMVVAEYDNCIIGNLDLTGNRRKMMEHTAVIGMGILPEWQHSGLGTAMLRAAIEWAVKNPALELLWLQVFTENQPGIALYRKMGFTDNGIIRNFFRQDNTYFHQLTMTLDVKAAIIKTEQ
jgi:RimJ/RimL family protein N-acetyltransferase